MQNVTPATIAVLVLELIPAIGFGLATERVASMIGRWPVLLRTLCPAILVLPYLLISLPAHIFLMAMVCDICHVADRNRVAADAGREH